MLTFTENTIFINRMYSMSLYQTTTRPSRITSYSTTFIDNILINNNILIIRDCLKIKLSKHLRTEEAINSLYHDLKDQDWNTVYKQKM